jgi:3-oxoacyl-[acyl-carrier protein] reductase
MDRDEAGMDRDEASMDRDEASMAGTRQAWTAARRAWTVSYTRGYILGMDPIQSVLSSSAGRALARRLGVAPPPELRRHQPGQPLLVGPALVSSAPGGRLAAAVSPILKAAGAEVTELPAAGGEPPAGPRWGALVVDASGIADTGGLAVLRDVLGPGVRALAPNGRVVVLGTPPALAGSTDAAIAQRALEGFTRSLAKELRGGATAQLVLVAPGAEGRLASTLRFLASARSAFVDGQVIEISTTVPDGVAGRVEAPDPERPLAGRVIVVTGAARGIGAAMVAAFDRDGARVLGVDVAPLAADLQRVTAAGGSHLVGDVTAPDAGARIARAVRERYGTLHGIVHNAGITRDRKLVNLSAQAWHQVIEVNLAGPRRITADLLADGVLGEGGRVVGISSVAGIAGNGGQTHYAASKAGVIGLVDALAPDLAPRGITVNAVAPGFIETRMTRTIPLALREGGRRLSSLRQGGLPVDVAEAAAWLLDPASAGVTGNVVRVCGQALLGA